MEWLTTYQIGTNKNILSPIIISPVYTFYVQNTIINTSLYYLGILVVQL